MNKHFIFLVIFCLFMASCTTAPLQDFPANQDQSKISTQNTPEVFDFEKTISPTNATLSFVTQTALVTPLIPTSAQAKPSTMTTSEAKIFFTSTIKSNGRCELPCVWGIQPNEGLDQKGLEFFNRLSDVDSAGDLNIYIYNTTNSSAQRSLTLILWKDDIRTTTFLNVFRDVSIPIHTTLVSEIAREAGTGSETQSSLAYGEYPNNQFLQSYWLPNILKIYGRPNEILIYTPMEDEMDKLDQPIFGILLLYTDKGFMVGYSFPREITETTFIGCPSDATDSFISTWDPVLNLSLEEMLSKLNGPVVNALVAHRYRPIQDVSTYTMDTFYDVFQKRDALSCISTPMGDWVIN